MGLRLQTTLSFARIKQACSLNHTHTCISGALHLFSWQILLICVLSLKSPVFLSVLLMLLLHALVIIRGGLAKLFSDPLTRSTELAEETSGISDLI